MCVIGSDKRARYPRVTKEAIRDMTHKYTTAAAILCLFPGIFVPGLSSVNMDKWIVQDFLHHVTNSTTSRTDLYVRVYGGGGVGVGVRVFVCVCERERERERERCCGVFFCV